MFVRGISDPIGSQFKLVLSFLICIQCLSGVTEYMTVVMTPGFLKRSVPGGEGKSVQVQ